MSVHIGVCNASHAYHVTPSSTRTNHQRCTATAYSPVLAAAADTEKARPQPRVGWSARTALKAKKVKAKRSLGQNFLQREDILSAIVSSASLQPDDRVLEIGPGTGNLTRHLLSTGARVTAVEKDDALYDGLQKLFAEELESGQLRLLHRDILEVSTELLLQTAHQLEADHVRSSTREGPLPKVVANLPYNITKLVMRKLLPLGGLYSDLFLMLQDEVALRLLAAPESGEDYRAMNVEVALYSHATYLFQVDRTAYVPEPNVDGAVVRFQLRPRSAYKVQDDLAFLAMVRQAFSERRKMVRNTLQSLYEPAAVAAALTAADIMDNVRPQQLTLAQYAQLWLRLQAA